MKKKYIYHGPTSGATLKEGDKPLEIMFFNGKEIELPEDNEYVKTLIALGHLKEIGHTVPIEEAENGG